MSIVAATFASDDLEQAWVQIGNEDEGYDLEEFELASQSGVHDRTQLETKIDFDLHSPSKSKGPGKSTNPSQYDIDLYLFLPKTLAVSPESYNRDEFYGDLTHLLRIRTPEPQAPSLSPSAHKVFQPINLESLDRYLQCHLHAQQRQALIELVVHDIKLYGCMVYSELKKVFKLLSRFLDQSQRDNHRPHGGMGQKSTANPRPARSSEHDSEHSPEHSSGNSSEHSCRNSAEHSFDHSPESTRGLRPDQPPSGPSNTKVPLAVTQVMERIESVHSAIRDYRQRYIWRVQHEPILIDEPVRTALWLVDEYLSYRLEGTLIAMSKLSEPFGDHLEDLRHQVEALLVGEVAYRQTVLEERGGKQFESPASLENHFYRLGLLKKYVSSVLFLDVKRVNRDYLYRNFIAAFGAALAAAFATVANIQTVRLVNNNEEFGLRVLAVLALGVIAYVFKDRIKDLIKDYFNSRLKTWLPDFDVEIFYPHYQPDGKKTKVRLGSSQEYMRYLEVGQVPSDISFLRDTTHATELEPEEQENVIHYHKSMNFEMHELREHLGGARVRKLHDVLRLDISHFLDKLADPQKQLSYFSPQHGIVTVDAPKVYHLNLIFRYRVLESGERGQSQAIVDYERLRIILNKQGIVRVDTVFPRGELGYSLTETRSGGRYLRQFERTSSAYAPRPSMTKKSAAPDRRDV